MRADRCEEHQPMTISETTLTSSQPAQAPSAPPYPDMVWVPGGTFRMGSNSHYPEEAPAHDVAVDGFWIDRHPVTNARFAKFVLANRYVTFAELAPDPADYPGALPEMLHPGSLVFHKPVRRVNRRDLRDWWRFTFDADWRHPGGPHTTVKDLGSHPVVHVTYGDAESFAEWEGKTIPTEAEWERAAWGGREGAIYAWGDELMPDGQAMANFWQGEFPHENTLADGWEGTSPVGAFPPNGYGIHDMIGNVWEWTADWYSARHQAGEHKACCVPRNPRGGSPGESLDPRTPDIRIPRKVLKGGSHLCAENFCRRYRPAARFPEPIDTSTSHVGFRCIVRPPR
jgi:formylglycine-generating enzyme required for sulfatase activity